MSGQTLHQSVLLNEVVDALGPQNGGCYLDEPLAMAAIAAPFLTPLAALFLPLTVILMRLPGARQCLLNMMADLTLPKVVFPT